MMYLQQYPTESLTKCVESIVWFTTYRRSLQRPSSGNKLKFAIQLAAAITACCIWIVPAQAQEVSKPGHLIVPELIGQSSARGIPGFTPSKVWVYENSGKPVSGKNIVASYPVGQKIPLPQGSYLVEVGTQQASENRIRVQVTSGLVTIVPTGLVVVQVEPPNAQTRDSCNRWTNVVSVSLQIGAKAGPQIATNRGNKGSGLGIVQVAAGYYRIRWNRFHVTAEVKANQSLLLPTALVGPMPDNPYTLHLKKGSGRNNVGLRLCRNRPTRVLARAYWGAYREQIPEYPYKKVVWEKISVEQQMTATGPSSSNFPPDRSNTDHLIR